MGLLIIGFYQVAQVTIAEQVFPIGEGGSITLGLIYVMSGIGSGLGPIVGRNWARDRELRLKTAIAAGYVCAFVGFAISATLISLPVILFGGLLRGFGGGLIWVLGTQLLLQIVPNEVRGRVFSTDFALYTLFAAVSSGATGIIIDVSGDLRLVLVTASALLLIPIGLWLLYIQAGKRKPALAAGEDFA